MYAQNVVMQWSCWYFALFGPSHVAMLIVLLPSSLPIWLLQPRKSYLSTEEAAMHCILYAGYTSMVELHISGRNEPAA